MDFHSLRKVELQLLKEDGLCLGWLGDAAFPNHSSLLGRRDHIYYFDLGDLVKDLTRLVAQSSSLAHLPQHLPEHVSQEAEYVLKCLMLAKVQIA